MLESDRLLMSSDSKFWLGKKIAQSLSSNSLCSNTYYRGPRYFRVLSCDSAYFTFWKGHIFQFIAFPTAKMSNFVIFGTTQNSKKKVKCSLNSKLKCQNQYFAVPEKFQSWFCQFYYKIKSAKSNFVFILIYLFFQTLWKNIFSGQTPYYSFCHKPSVPLPPLLLTWVLCYAKLQQNILHCTSPHDWA